MTLNAYLTNAFARPFFLISRIVTDDGIQKKLPCNPQGYTSDHTNPANHMTLEQAQAIIVKLGPGYHLGFSFTKLNQQFFIDIDKCINAEGLISEFARSIIKMFPGHYVEISQSGTGIHIIGSYTGDVTHLNKIKGLNIELYTQDRFVLLTGINARGDWNTDGTESLQLLITQLFNKAATVPAIAPPPPPQDMPIYTDEQVIAKAKDKVSASAAFGNGASFDDLYNNNVDALSRAYPPHMQGKDYDYSAADLALANKLIFAGATLDQAVSIMRGSALMRDKWDERTYLLDTVSRALTSRSDTQRAQSTTTDGSCQAVLSDMPQEFDGCYYIVSEREIYTTQYGMLNQDGFNMVYGGLVHKDPPYKAFKTYAAVSGRLIERLGFRPDLPHGEVYEREEEKLINTYKPLKIKMRQGDMTPFFKFFDKMIPNKRDQRIILSFVAVLAQKPGVKSQWAIVLQGVQGCGKSLFANFVAAACGEKFTHRAKGDEFENRFNSQWFGKTLILIEDPRLQHEKLDEVLKPMITSKLYAFEGKGKNVKMGDFPANFILTLNDFDLLQKRKETRRLAVFMSALQTPEDLILAGLDDEAWRNIVDWKENGGEEFFNYFIHNYTPDPEFDFSGKCVTAPHTSTTDRAIEESRPEIEVTLLEEIGNGRAGFKNGWISSTALTNMLIERRIRHLMPDNKRGRILKELGYTPHPGLNEGRAIRNLEPDNRRPTLFIKKDHPSTDITDREQIMKSYENGQKYT
jgi:hypothetical protein